jgi:hypothetical protein
MSQSALEIAENWAKLPTQSVQVKNNIAHLSASVHGKGLVRRKAYKESLISSNIKTENMEHNNETPVVALETKAKAKASKKATAKKGASKKTASKKTAAKKGTAKTAAKKTTTKAAAVGGKIREIIGLHLKGISK